jgi:hypothetical protein
VGVKLIILKIFNDIFYIIPFKIIKPKKEKKTNLSSIDNTGSMWQEAGMVGPQAKQHMIEVIL